MDLGSSLKCNFDAMNEKRALGYAMARGSIIDVLIDLLSQLK